MHDLVWLKLSYRIIWISHKFIDHGLQFLDQDIQNYSLQGYREIWCDNEETT